MEIRATSIRRKKKTAPSIDVDAPPIDMPRPNAYRETMLPIYSVGEWKFEELCRDVLKHAFPQVARSALKRTRGVAQFGVDVEGFNASHQCEIVVSCKCHEHVPPRSLVPWTRDFVKHLDGHWKDQGVRVFVLAVTHPGNSDELTKAVRACQDLLKPHHIRFVIWDMLVVTDLLRKELSLIDRYFNPAWREAISPQEVFAVGLSRDSAPPPTGQSQAIIELAKQITELSRQTNALGAQRIEAANAEYRAGRSAPLLACLEDLQAEPSWPNLDASIRARVLRSRAMLALNGDDAATAGRLLDEADKVAAAPDRSTRAWYIRATEGPEKAKDFLRDPRCTIEIEVLAMLFMETGKITDAVATLDAAAPPATPEQLRLRALAQCIMGEREAAVATAAFASAGPTPSTAAVQSHAVLHIMAALSRGAEIQLRAVPNPISAALVRVTPDAIAHLDAAIDLLSRQIALVDPPLVADLELWKLGALLLHPTRTRDARAFADEMLNRANVDPLAVAWCHSYGMRLKYGRIKKLFEDAIRSGAGTPSHVVMLSILEAERNGPEAASRLIARHRATFASHDEFLLAWQKRFSGDPGPDPFAIAMQKAERNNHTQLLTHLESETCSANQLLAAAGLLAAGKKWNEVNRLRGKLVLVGTPHAVDLAARAAFESGEPVATVAILEAAKSIFPQDQLTESLTLLRARAYEQQGSKGAAIADLRSIAERSRDPAVRSYLMHSLIRIGEVREASQHAKKLLELLSTKPLELVQLADVFKHVDAEFSRSSVQRAADDPKLPHHAVGSVMTLANTLGLVGVETRMLQLVGEITKNGPAAGIVRFESIENVVAHLRERSEEQQREYDEWRAGMRPGHAIFDVGPFAALYLADANDRKNARNEPMPMLVRAANAGRRTSIVGMDAKPVLILDISALLLAKRCNLLDQVEQAYSIQIPEAVPLALASIADVWTDASEEFVQAAKAWLSNSQTAVRIVESPPPEPMSCLGAPRPVRPSRAKPQRDSMVKRPKRGRQSPSPSRAPATAKISRMSICDRRLGRYSTSTDADQSLKHGRVRTVRAPCTWTGYAAGMLTIAAVEKFRPKLARSPPRHRHRYSSRKQRSARSGDV